MKSKLFFFIFFTLCFSFSQPLCNNNERTLLLRFKESFAVEEFASTDSSAYPKTDSWGRTGNDCCIWDGVECDQDTGHVIGLDLSSSFLYGSIGSNATLFGLTHLERLNLADNDFNYSQIPSSIARLLKLTQLNFSLSVFSGQIPHELLSLSLLSSLDLSRKGYIYERKNLLQLKNPGFHNLTKSLTRLKLLNLGLVDISAGVPHSLANLSSLEFLLLENCWLQGSIPSFIGTLHRLRLLDLSRNRLNGQIPSLANLTRLEGLDLSSNYYFESGNILSWLGNPTKIRFLLAEDTNLIGPLPSFLGNLTRLIAFNFHGNYLSGRIPIAFSRLVNLQYIILSGNNLSGEVSFEMFLGLKNLTDLELDGNKLSVLIKPSTNETLPQFHWLGLESCNLKEFPKFLRHQKRLELLTLSDNVISGKVPEWLWNTSTQTLEYLSLGNNYLTGYLPPVLPFFNLHFFVVHQNLFKGPIPIPPPSIVMYQASRNAFDSEIPTLFCKRETSIFKNQLEMIDLSGNKIQGKLPHSLANCTMLQYINLEDNKLDDVFPHWLGTLRHLQVLLLGSNQFHGEIRKPEEDKFPFPRLKIIVLSYNSFGGVLPSQYFRVWKAMQASTTKREANYSSVSSTSSEGGFVRSFFYILIKIKGVKRNFYKLNEDLFVVDLSHNKFNGRIPKTIRTLKGLHSLDLSNNRLSGHIPSSLEGLTNLESLDLSINKLSGKIPQELTNLSFLQYFNVSYNHLAGTIPQGGQLTSFPSTCYEGNPGLCGIPLQNKCEPSEPEPPSSEAEQEESSSPFIFGWKVVAIGYGCGFIVGVLIGNVVVARNQRWFSMIFRVRIFK